MRIIENESFASLFSKERVTVIVTDSGMGGLSIFAEMAAKLKNAPVFSHVSLIYFNAWPEQNRGYNTIKDMHERVRVFNKALEGMMRFGPDIILIACNTLSVLFDRTDFSKRETVPVVDIVRFGVEMVHESLSKDPGKMALLIGTNTTIESDLHRQKLIERGIAAHRIAVQACNQLATQIEKGPQSDSVAELINTCMDQAAEKLGPENRDVEIALLCTHFGYSRELIRENLQKRISGKTTVLDPNQRMAAFLFEKSDGLHHRRASSELKIVSKIFWDPEKIEAISGAIRSVSPETAQALRRYRWMPDLFSF